jgi:hypothetical protein
MKDLVLKYKQKGYSAVSRDNLYYRLRCYKAAQSGEVIGTSVTLITGHQSTLSDLTSNNVSNPSDINPINDATTNINNITMISGDNNNGANNITAKKGGRPKGSTKAAAEKINALLKESVTKAAILYNKAFEEAQNSGKKAVPKGTLDKIVSDVETEAGLSKNSISLETVRSRIKRGNLDAIRTYSLSPIADLEPLIVVFCIRLAKLVTH